MATANAATIIERRYFHGNPPMQALLAEAEVHAAIARRIRELRNRAGLSQRALAVQVGTTAATIARLEHADYPNGAVAMLRRIAAALGQHGAIPLPHSGNTPYSPVFPNARPPRG